MKLNDEQRAELRSLIERADNHRITPRMVWEHAKSEDSSLHNLFQWDTTNAAIAHWDERARYILQSFRIIVRRKNGSGEKTPFRIVLAPAVLSVGDGYFAVEEVMADEERARTQVASELDRFALAAGRLGSICEMSEYHGELGKWARECERNARFRQNQLQARGKVRLDGLG